MRQNRTLAEVPRAAGPQNIAQPQGSEPYCQPRLARPVFAMLGRKKRSPIDVDVIGCPVINIPGLAPDPHETLFLQKLDGEALPQVRRIKHRNVENARPPFIEQLVRTADPRPDGDLRL